MDRHRRGPAERLPVRMLIGIFLIVLAVPEMLHGAERRDSGEYSDLAQLATQFRACRDLLKREQPPPPSELRKWGGPLHKLMNEIGERLERGHYSSRRVSALLGKPDEVISGGGRHNGIAVPRRESHWIYWWRGGHDYLYLIVRHGRVEQARWWHAWE